MCELCRGLTSRVVRVAGRADADRELAQSLVGDTKGGSEDADGDTEALPLGAQLLSDGSLDAPVGYRGRLLTGRVHGAGVAAVLYRRGMDYSSGRRYAKGIAKRESILDAALTVFGDVGFHGASLREIARRCGVSHQALMHYFPTKQELLMSVLRRRDERLARHFGNSEGLRIDELIALAEDNAVMPGVIELFSMASAEATTEGHPAHEYYAHFYEQIVSSATLYLAIAQERDALAPGVSAEDAARLILAAQDGLQLQWLYDRDSVSVSRLMRALVSTLISVPLEELDADLKTRASGVSRK